MLKMINPSLCKDGWLLGRDASSEKIAFISHLKVETTNVKDGRQHFVVAEGLVVAEGPLKGKKGSVLLTVDGVSTLVDVSHSPEGLVFIDFQKSQVDSYDHMSGTLWLGSRPVPPKPPVNSADFTRHMTELGAYVGKIAAGISLVTRASKPVPAGWNPLEIPDAPHPGGTYYSDQSLYSTVWFRVGHSGDRYLHPGKVSNGCATVSAQGWTKIYQYLIGRRKDINSVGAIHVAYID